MARGGHPLAPVTGRQFAYPAPGRDPVTPLLAIDGHHLLYRSWWGFSDRRIMSRDKARDLTGVFGFLAILRKTHLELTPDHEVIVVFDGENAAASRQARDAGYKVGRAVADHSPIGSLAMVKNGLTAAGITWTELDDYEGDDVIATLTRTGTASGRPVTCYSGDRDLLQLANDTVTILSPARRTITPADVLARHGVTPRQWPDYRALTGDPSDNIPGVRGIGPDRRQAPGRRPAPGAATAGGAWPEPVTVPGDHRFLGPDPHLARPDPPGPPGTAPARTHHRAGHPRHAQSRHHPGRPQAVVTS